MLFLRQLHTADQYLEAFGWRRDAKPVGSLITTERMAPGRTTYVYSFKADGVLQSDIRFWGISRVHRNQLRTRAWAPIAAIEASSRPRVLVPISGYWRSDEERPVDFPAPRLVAGVMSPCEQHGTAAVLAFVEGDDGVIPCVFESPAAAEHWVRGVPLLPVT